MNGYNSSRGRREAPVLEIDDLCVEIRSQSRVFRALRGVSFQVRAGEMFGIVGESGSGKTMTILSVTGLLPPSARIARGSIKFRDEELVGAAHERLEEIRGRQVATIFQDPMTSFNPIMRVGQQVAEPLYIHGLGGERGASDLAEELLRRVRIPDARERMRWYPHEFSGGMRQRALMAMALILGPELILADEPTTALDVTIQAQVLELLRELNQQSGAAVVLVSHDLGVVADNCVTIAVMYAGRIVEVGPAKDLLISPQHPYTRALVEAFPSLNVPPGAPLSAIGGEAPNLAALPPGCPFHPRCRYRIDRCEEVEPALLKVGSTQSACWVAQDGQLQALAERLADRKSTGMPAEAPARALATVQIKPHGIPPTTPLLSLRGINHHFPIPSGVPFRPSRRLHSINDVSLDVFHGETLAVVGETGCGKSTLARCVLRLYDVDEGRIFFRGEDITRLRGERLRRLRRFMQPIFQDPYASLNPRSRVRDLVAEPLYAHGITGKEAEERVTEALELVGLDSSLGDRFPHEFSGGQRQRIGIARAMVLRPDLVVADEPLSALDVSIQAQIINLLLELQRKLALTYIFISHDLRVVRHVSSKVAIMYLGKIVEYGPTAEVCAGPRHPYTQALLSSVPALPGDQPSRPQTFLRADLPSPMSPPSGCYFRTRCPFAQDRCLIEAPTLEELSPGHTASCFFPLPARKSK